jgi:hypothetical protein
MPIGLDIRDSVLFCELEGDCDLRGMTAVLEKALDDPLTAGLPLLVDARRSERLASGDEINAWADRLVALRDKGLPARVGILPAMEPQRLGIARMAVQCLESRGMHSRVFLGFDSAVKWVSVKTMTLGAGY